MRTSRSLPDILPVLANLAETSEGYTCEISQKKAELDTVTKQTDEAKAQHEQDLGRMKAEAEITSKALRGQNAALEAERDAKQGDVNELEAKIALHERVLAELRARLT